MGDNLNDSTPTATTAVAEAEGTMAEEEEGADIPTEGSGIQEESKSAALARRLVVGARVEKGKEEYQVGLSGITWKNRGHEKIGKTKKGRKFYV